MKCWSAHANICFSYIAHDHPCLDLDYPSRNWWPKLKCRKTHTDLQKTLFLLDPKTHTHTFLPWPTKACCFLIAVLGFLLVRRVGRGCCGPIWTIPPASREVEIQAMKLAADRRLSMIWQNDSSTRICPPH